MDMDPHQSWIKEFNDFVTYWEREIDSLKNTAIDPDECNVISELFNRDKNILLCKKPSSFTDDEFISHITPLTTKLDVCLAMALKK
ncbi:MAG: hypothetical protein QXS02_04265 [Candidatus Thermoplasmatota archaeon]